MSKKPKKELKDLKPINEFVPCDLLGGFLSNEEHNNEKWYPKRCSNGNCNEEERHRHDCEHNKHGREDQERVREF